MTKKTLSYSELLSKAYSSDPLYKGFQDGLNLMSYGEATQTLGQLEEIHQAYFKAMDSTTGYSFSESDYSFSGLMDFIKTVADKTGKGIQRHNDASAKLVENLANPERMAGKAGDFLTNLSSNIGANISQAQYKKMLDDGADLDEYGGKTNLAKFVKAIESGWDRDRNANRKAGTWSKGREDRYQAGKADSEGRLDSYKANKGEAKEDPDNIDYFMDDEPEVTPPAPAAPAAAPAPAPEVSAPEPALEPGQEGVEVTKKGRGASKRNPQKWGTPEGKRATPGMGNAWANMRKTIGGDRNGLIDTSEEQAFMENMDQFTSYAQQYMEKGGCDMGELLQSYTEQAFGETKKAPAKDKYKSMYEKYSKKAKKAKDPAEKKKLGKQAASCKAKMKYSEYMDAGNTTKASGMVKAALKIVTAREGLNFSEKNPSVGEILAKAAQYSFMEAGYAYPKTGNPSKFASGSKSVEHNYTEDEEQPEGGSMLESPELMQMLNSLSQEEKDQLIAALQGSGEDQGQSEAPEAKEESDDKEDDSDDKEYGEDCDDSDKEEYGEDPEKAEEYAEDCDKAKSTTYSEKLASQDEAKDKFLADCRHNFSEFEYVNQYYDVPLQFGENSTYDFSEWTSAFKNANSSAFNMFGMECGFNGNLPSNIVVVDADDSTDAAWAVYDKGGSFVTLSGIKPFKQLAFSENFKDAYCTSTRGSALKSDRVARAALCSR